MRSSLAALVIVLAAACGFAGEKNGPPVADYRFDEGTGTTLHDRSPAGNHATIHGAAWVRCGDGFALRLDGRDDYVDCGSPAAVDLAKAVSVEAWVLPEAVPAAGEPGVVGKSYGSYVLTYYADGRFWWYVSGGGNKCQAPAPPGTWHHVAGTFDGRTLQALRRRRAGRHGRVEDADHRPRRPAAAGHQRRRPAVHPGARTSRG